MNELSSRLVAMAEEVNHLQNLYTEAVSRRNYWQAIAGQLLERIPEAGALEDAMRAVDSTKS